MLPHIGTVCKFTLTTKFTTLNGIYNTLSLATYDSLIADGVDFVKNLYTPAGMAQSDYLTDYTNYKGGDVVVVSPVTDSTITYYFPESIIALMPDPTVRKYSQVGLWIPIGAFKDPSNYTFIKDQVSDLVASVTGEANTAYFAADPNEAVYLTESDYETLDTTRQKNIKTIQPLTTQINTLTSLVNTLQAQVTTLTDKLISVSQSSTTTDTSGTDTSNTSTTGTDTTNTDTSGTNTTTGT